MKPRLLLLPLLLLLSASMARAATVSLVPVASGFTRPVQVVSAGDAPFRMYVAQQNGTIYILENGSRVAEPFLDISSIVDCCENGGLLSIAFHPRYFTNGRFFLLYVDRNGDTVLARYLRSTTDRDRAVPVASEILLTVDQPADETPNHHGGTVAFGPDGYLYVSIGDGGASPVTRRAQSLDGLFGKLLRIDVDVLAGPYAIPRDNPFAGVAGVRPEIWATGLRNPWRFSFDKQTGDLFLADVGQESWEEVNIVSAGDARGGNFGWPLMEGRHCFPPNASCDATGLLLPPIEYARTGGDCSVTGGFMHRGKRATALNGIYLFGDFCSGRIRGATRGQQGWTSSVLADTTALIVSFGEDEQGEVYVVDYAGSIYRLVSAATPLRRRTSRQ